MTYNDKAILKAVQTFGHRFDPEVIGAMRKLIAPMHDAQQLAAMHCKSDLSYGPLERQRLDVYGSADVPAPALLFVHGGGFTAGDKSSPDGAPFYKNIGWFAKMNGMVGVAMTYPLAPGFKWPHGAQDIGMALTYLHENAAELGIDPNRIVLMGQSAGAVHVANYLSHPDLYSQYGCGVCAGIFVSGLYDMVAAESNPPKRSYFAEELSEQASQSPLPALLDVDIPLLVAVNEFDIPEFEKQASMYFSEYAGRKGHLPWLSQIKGHNHISSILSLGLGGDPLGNEIAAFLNRHSFITSSESNN